MSEPSTEAGRRLLGQLALDYNTTRTGYRQDDILAIEAAARHAALSDLREKVEGLERRHIRPQMYSPATGGFFKGDAGFWLDRNLVLALIDKALAAAGDE